MNEFAVLIGIIIFPGLIAAIVVEKITTRTKPWGALKYGMYSFILGLISYTVLQSITLIWQAVFENPISYSYLSVWQFIFNPEAKFLLSDVFWATVIAIPVGITIAAILNHKLINRLARSFNASSKYGDENLFSYFLDHRDTDWIYIRDKEQGLTYQGRILSYSEVENMQELVLSDVTIYGYDDSQEYYSVPKLYLSKPIGEFRIESVPKELLISETINE